ncbi:hypothetical protein AnaeK_3078 [Anaeromyxobacter sp. K]|uniref:hypothetical protein n=1 Tax=Anaeromyxobacter sp. (strain K) TaxID=447217 RepID=UPI00015F88C3|nr:hypothetical protein [Anaeromyxobacter sp. K]ACG74299.1 hypothetical protein AnaeK_3078 [Anaeromyxobacter sp. K]
MSLVVEAILPYSVTTSLDGLGREMSSLDSEGVQTNTRYDSMGRPWFKSYPFDVASGEVGERQEFDSLGRIFRSTRGYRPDVNACDAPGACVVDLYFTGNCTRVEVQRGPSDVTVKWSCHTSFGNPDEQRLTQIGDEWGRDPS